MTDVPRAARPPALTAAGWTVAVTAAWVVLAVLRPTVTYHLASLVLAAVYPAVRWSGRRATASEAAWAAVVGGLVAVAVSTALWGVDVLRGPALVGGNAYGESLIGAGAGAVVGFALARSSR